MAEAGGVREIWRQSVDRNQETTRWGSHARCLAITAVSHRADAQRRVAPERAAESFPIRYEGLLSFSLRFAHYKIALPKGTAELCAKVGDGMKG
jgi:hypothetical protein